jgi:hypothetical protein
MAHDDSGYVIAIHRDGEYSFLADRRKQKEKWWVPDLAGAFVFGSGHAAQAKCSQFHCNNPKVYARSFFDNRKG